MGPYVFYSGPDADPFTWRVLNTSSMKWYGTIIRTSDGRWKSVNGNTFDTPFGAAIDNESAGIFDKGRKNAN
jgi:hypothetical protein